MKYHVEELLSQANHTNDEKDKIILALGMVIDSLVAKLEQTGHNLQSILDAYDEMNPDTASEIKDVVFGCTDVEMVVEV